MPYIKQEDREAFKASLEEVKAQGIQNAGELNYLITEIVQAYIKQHELKYNTVNEAVGALECCKLELYRRIAAPYEDKKITENGEVYNLEEKSNKSKIGFYSCLRTKSECPKMIEGDVHLVPSMFGKRSMTVKKVTESSATLEDEHCLTFAHKEDGQWFFDHTLINKKGVTGIII